MTDLHDKEKKKWTVNLVEVAFYGKDRKIERIIAKNLKARDLSIISSLL